LRTLEKCRKHSPAARVSYISLVFSNARRVLSQCNTRLRLLCLLINTLYEFRIFCSADLYDVILGCDETTILTSLSLCNSRGVNSTYHCHYTMASADMVVSVQCIQFE